MVKPGDIVLSHPRWGEGHRVCFITEHSSISTVALQLNSQTQLSFKELAVLKGYDCAEDRSVFYGGDYNGSALIMLHDNNWYSANTMIVNSAWSISSDLHMMEKVQDGNTPHSYRYIMGITAWPQHSLEQDLHSERPKWIVLNSPSTDLVMAEPEQHYRLALEAAGSIFWRNYF